MRNGLFGSIVVDRRGRILRAFLMHGNHSVERRYEGTAKVRTVIASWAAIIRSIERTAGLTVHIPRAEAMLIDGQRSCASCGDFIDPVDWCTYCRENRSPCLRPHKRLRLRADAAFCNSACRAEQRASFIRDCT